MKVAKGSVWFSLVCTLVLFLLHLVLPTMVNGFQRNQSSASIWQILWNDTYGESLCLDRLKLCEFYRRPLMYRLQMALHEVGIPYQFSFVFISFLCLFFVSRLLLMVARQLHVADRWRNWILIIFFLHFSILFAFFDSMSTYDEPITYVLLLLSFYFLLKGKTLWWMLFFLLSAIGRETVFCYWPLFIWLEPEKKALRKWGYFLLLPILYMLYLYLYLPGTVQTESLQFLTTQRGFAWKYNFRNGYESIQSILCAFMVLAIPLYLLIQIRKQENLTSVQKKLILYSIGFCVVNTFLVWFTGLAAEARLFTLPLLLGLPLWCLYFERIGTHYSSWRNWLSWDILLAGMGSAVFIWRFYRCYESTFWAATFFKAYAVFSMLGLYLLIKVKRRNYVSAQ
ncbi:MAG TPA: hypothetical protein PLP34_00880 [Chitinophagaceae bacterium]|nr:hypothetical protein [Chitinophagaceae bacterium]HNF70935.1 hypothetical protein [Chitinophagaceae bacterium]